MSPRACLLVSTLMVMGCRANTPAEKVITLGVQQEPDSLWLPFREMIAADEVLRAGAMTLTVFNEKWELVPHAAVSIPTVQNGGVQLLPDGRMVTTWQLRDDLVWADGVPLTADDFVFALEIWQDPAQEIADRTYAEQVEKAEAVGADKRTLRVTWKTAYAYHANYRALEALPRHVLAPVVAARTPLKQHPFGARPLMAGPFTVDAWERGSFVSLKRNPHATSPRARPKVDRLVFRLIPQTTALEAALLAGTVDAISPVGLHADQLIELQRRHPDRFDYHWVDGLSWEHVALNLEDRWLKDVRMRRALMMGLDRSAMVAALFGPRMKVADTFVPSRHRDYAADVRVYPHDVAGARALIQEMGFTAGADGIYEKDGEKLRFTIQTTAGVSTRERVEQVMQSDWRKIGVDLVIENVPARMLFSDLLRRRKFKHMVMFAWLQDPLRISDAQGRCDMIPAEANAWQGQNYGGWCNAEATAWFKDANRELDDAKRTVLLQRIQRAWAEEIPALPLYFRPEVSVTRRGFRGWKPTGTLTPVTWNAQEWSLSRE